MPAGIGSSVDHMKSLPGRLTRRRKLIAGVLVVALLAALAASLVQQREYTATAEVLLPAAGQQELLAAAFARQPDTQVIAERTARALDGIRSGQQIANEVDIDGGGASAVIRVRDRDDSVAARVATEFARQYASAQVDLAYRSALRGGGQVEADAGNLVPNPGFEEGSRGWVPIQQPSPGWGVTTSWAGEGQASLRAQSDGRRSGAATPEGVAGIPVEGGARYLLSALVRAPRLDKPRVAYLRLGWSSGSGEFISYSPRLYVPGPGTTRLRYRTPVRSPQEATYARVELIVEPASGRRADLYLDDVKLAPVGGGSAVRAPAASRASRLVRATLRSGPLVEPAAVPSEPSEPRVRSTLLIALLLGIFAAFAVAALTGRRDAL